MQAEKKNNIIFENVSEKAKPVYLGFFMYLEIFVHLKVPDVVAATARHTLQHVMCYDKMADLDRWDYWRIEVADDSSAIQNIKNTISTVSEMININKHFFILRENSGALELKGKEKTKKAQEVRILVRESGKDSAAEGMRKILQKKYGNVIKGVDKGTLWVLSIDMQSREEAESYAKRIAETKRQDEGLLANTNCQEYSIFK